MDVAIHKSGAVRKGNTITQLCKTGTLPGWYKVLIHILR